MGRIRTKKRFNILFYPTPMITFLKKYLDKLHLKGLKLTIPTIFQINYEADVNIIIYRD